MSVDQNILVLNLLQQGKDELGIGWTEVNGINSKEITFNIEGNCDIIQNVRDIESWKKWPDECISTIRFLYLPTDVFIGCSFALFKELFRILKPNGNIPAR